MKNRSSLNTSLSVAVIMDGNRRWAKERGLLPYKGHVAGYEKLLSFLDWSLEEKIPYVTVFAFSTENWKRSKAEIDKLQGLIQRFGKEDKDNFTKKGIKVVFIGKHDDFDEETRNSIKRIEEATKDRNELVFTVALSYGGRQDIVMAAEAWSRSGVEATEADFARFLQTSHIPDPDLVIRSGGEARVSNFLLWQMAYSEIFFTDTFWPEFSKEEFMRIIDDFSHRSRRRGV
ncbi:MAG: polyprenyl diphosphate synthase [Candidatus Paceibacterota bacterium]